MSETVTETRQDFRIKELLADPYDRALFDRGSITGAHYEPIIESRGSFADEVSARLEAFASERPDEKPLTEEPAFILGVVSTVSARREEMKQAELLSTVQSYGGSE